MDKRIIYVSRAVSSITQDDLTQIERSSVRRNDEDDITGALFFGKGWFLQVIEGDEHAVDQLMLRIRDDKRHSDVVRVSKCDADVRLFPSWNMGVFNLEKSGAIIDVDRLVAAASLAIEEQDPKQAYVAIIKFINEFQRQVCASAEANWLSPHTF